MPNRVMQKPNAWKCLPDKNEIRAQQNAQMARAAELAAKEALDDGQKKKN